MVEFPLRKEILREPIESTVKQSVSSIDAICAYCTTQWLTLRYPDGTSNVLRGGRYAVRI